MTLMTARSLLIRDRQDWDRPRAPWLPDAFYALKALSRRIR